MADETVAQKDTMTCYGVTVDQLIASGAQDATEKQAEIDRLKGEVTNALKEVSEGYSRIEGLEQTIRTHVATIENRDAALGSKDRIIQEMVNRADEASRTVTNLGVDLAVARVVAQDAQAIASFRRLPDGGLQTLVTLDRDTAMPILEQADQAGESVPEFVQKTLNEALLAYTSS